MTRIKTQPVGLEMTGRVVVLLAGILTGTLVATAFSQIVPSASTPGAKPSSVARPTRYQPDRFAGRAGEYFRLIWGVDSIKVKAVESGELIRFTYRVVDPNKATVFNDKKIDAFLDFPQAHARLVIPTLEKVGQLRQYNTPDAGKSYWMAFSNPQLTVKRGDHVNIVIGQFHADGLVVE
jgi:hypothetical protein